MHYRSFRGNALILFIKTLSGSEEMAQKLRELVTLPEFSFHMVAHSYRGTQAFLWTSVGTASMWCPGIHAGKTSRTH